jgi:hypothetical protein
MIFSLKIFSSDQENNYEYEFGFRTKYQHYSIPVLFQAIKGALESTNPKIELTTFPVSFFYLLLIYFHHIYFILIYFKTHIAAFPVMIKNTFDKTIKISSIEFSNFGNAFFFKWLPQGRAESGKIDEANVIRANKTRKIGHILFDASILCKETNYVGFNEDKTINLNDLFNNNQTSSSSISPLLNEINLKNNNNKIYELWLTSFSLDNKTYEIDKLLFNYYHNLNWIKKWKLVNQNLNYEIKTKLKAGIKNFTINNSKKFDEKTEKKVLNYNVMNINIKYKWPKLLSLQQQQQPQPDLNIIKFPLTQIGSFEIKNVTLTNPSNTNSLFIQMIFIENYPIENKNTLIEMFKSSNYDLGLDDYLDDISSVDDLFISESAFSFHSHKLSNQGIVPLTKYKNMQLGNTNNKENLLFLLQRSQRVTLQIQFRPFKKQIYSTLLIIRNNLTILDTYIFHGEGGSGELRLSNRRPNTKIPLVIEMSTRQFKQCELIKSRQKELYIENEVENNEIIDNLTLRKSFKLKNHGNLNIFINEIRIDKMKCSAFGFEIGTCKNILLEPNQTYELDIKYQPDFTMSKIVKELEFETNLGIFKYDLHVKIPKTMLNTCHQVLPRPKFEKYFYYFAILLITMFICILIIVAIFESRNILRYHFETQHSLNEQHQKQVNLQEFVSEYQLQRSYLINSQKKNLTINTTPIKTKTSSKQQQSLAKQLSAGSTDLINNKVAQTKQISKTVSSPQENKKPITKKQTSTNLVTTTALSLSNEQLNQQQPRVTKKQQTPPLSPSALSTTSSSSSSSPTPKQTDFFKIVNQNTKQPQQFGNKKRKDGPSDEQIMKLQQPATFTNKLFYNANKKPIQKITTSNNDEYHARYIPQNNNKIKEQQQQHPQSSDSHQNSNNTHLKITNQHLFQSVLDTNYLANSLHLANNNEAPRK